MKAITLDIWGTLLTDNPVFEREQKLIIADEFCLQDEQNTFDLLCTADRHYTKLTEQTGQDFGFDDRLRMMAKAKNRECTDEQCDRTRMKIYDVFLQTLPLLLEQKVTLETLELLQKKGIPICLVSNTGFIAGETMRIALQKIGILPLVQDAVFSNEVGYGKPHNKIFAAALQTQALHAVNADQVTHVGDSPISDFQGATAAGLQCFLLNIAKKELPSNISQLHSLGELIQKL